MRERKGRGWRERDVNRQGEIMNRTESGGREMPLHVIVVTTMPVSYTHLDVYKRQILYKIIKTSEDIE